MERFLRTDRPAGIIHFFTVVEFSQQQLSFPRQWHARAAIRTRNIHQCVARILLLLLLHCTRLPRNYSIPRTGSKQRRPPARRSKV